jgi:hypothetical protein
MGQQGELAFNFDVGGCFQIVAMTVPLFADQVNPELGSFSILPSAFL